MKDVGATSLRRLTRPVHVGLLTPYFAFFDDRFPSAFRAAQEEYASNLASRLAASGAEVVASGLVYSSETAAVARGRFAEAGIEVIVIAPLMASPPRFVLEALDGVDAPVVVWNDRRVDELENHLDEVEATRVSSILGSIMAANVLARSNVRFAVVTTRGGADKALGRAIRSASLGPRLRTLRLGIMGEPVPGYDDVVLGASAADRLGVTLVPVVTESFLRMYRDVKDAGRVRSREALVAAGVEVAATSPSQLLASLDVHCALERVVAEYEVDALVINCHSEALRWNRDVGIVACLGASLLTSAGYPVSCTGDSATVVSLTVATVLTGHAQYCEGYVLAGQSGELLLSSCGMADLALRAPGVPTTVAPNELYPGHRGLGCLCRHGFPSGAASIISFAPGSDGEAPTLMWASGDLTGRYFDGLNGPSGGFIFASGDGEAAIQRWIEVAPAHHVALTEGRLDLEFEVAERLLDIRMVNV